jgi:hypothetical protein
MRCTTWASSCARTSTRSPPRLPVINTHCAWLWPCSRDVDQDRGVRLGLAHHRDAVGVVRPGHRLDRRRRKRLRRVRQKRPCIVGHRLPGIDRWVAVGVWSWLHHACSTTRTASGDASRFRDVRNLRDSFGDQVRRAGDRDRRRLPAVGPGPDWRAWCDRRDRSRVVRSICGRWGWSIRCCRRVVVAGPSRRRVWRGGVESTGRACSPRWWCRLVPIRWCGRVRNGRLAGCSWGTGRSGLWR